MAPAEQHLEELRYLWLLLHHLPNFVPLHDVESTQYNFSVNKDSLIDIGDTNSAVNCILGVSFGSCSEMNGIVPIKEKGPGIFAIVDVLHMDLTEDPRDAPLALWLENISASAEVVYKAVGKEVCDRDFIVLKQCLTIYPTKSSWTPKLHLQKL